MKDVSVSIDAPFPPVATETAAYFTALREAGFRGDIGGDIANRITFATDNSIYQIPSQGVIFPYDGEDMTCAIHVANRPDFAHLTFTPRGGGTGCNGQSLGDGIIIDTSRHMRRILDFDRKAQRIKIEPGVIRDQLNAYLEPYGFFFPPHVSTSSRATIGGMVSNDSSGKGSIVYGKTSAHIEAVEVLLPDGREFEFNESGAGDANAGIAQSVAEIIGPHRAEIRNVFPDLNRGFTGYDLLNAMDEAGDVSLASLICGSEGTLALIKSVTCRVTRIPAMTAVVAIRYEALDDGLRAVPGLLTVKPTAIEFIDDKILNMAQESEFWPVAGAVLSGPEDEARAQAMHFVEFEGESAAELRQKTVALDAHLGACSGRPGGPLGWRAAMDPADIRAIWDMRKACQGLLLSQQGRRRAQPFIEDFVVPPKHLADFIAELNLMLAERGVDVGMFGHADVGVVHMRPLLEMTKPEDRRLIRDISDKVFELTRKYGGLIWGEHGKGFRGEYSAAVLGPRLMDATAEIKALFDPRNRLNPGKIATPKGHDAKLLALDAAPMRGAYDQAISKELLAQFPKALHCNGNGNCFSLDSAAPICPSYKATGDRRYSPKGRAGLIREWLRLRATGDEDALAELTPGLYDAFDTCLACKSCSGGGCPVRIDIPQMKAGFNEWYFARNRRPVSDLFVRNLETWLPLLARIAPLANGVQGFAPVKALIREWLGIVDLPQLNGLAFEKGLKSLGVPLLSAEAIVALSVERRKGLLVIVQDGFTTFYDAEVALAQVALIKRLGANIVVLSYRAGGKPLHINGHLERFRSLARKNARDLSVIAAAGAELLGLDPATTLMYRDEYEEVNDEFPPYRVLLPSEWLNRADLPKLASKATYQLIQHCTEKSVHPETTAQWLQIFGRAGLELEIVDAGCCGMAGLFGHEACHKKMSRTLYDQTWRDVAEGAEAGRLMATGYSCRSQVKRFSGVRALHPAEGLMARLKP